MIEKRILDAFPGKGENQRIRAVLFSIAWAFEAYQLEEELVGPTLNTIIRTRKLDPEEVGILLDKLRETMTSLRRAAKLIENSILTLDSIMLEREVTRRNVS